ncbi:nitrate reductase [Thalassospira profundimaris]|uniref:Nitrate reductase n=1 Tax=Thalassospira profundimaris TaxID=502049 RepID=A0A367WYN1_9PROT|nr:nitrate reductase molybdenum cofactor assembly chaperone [Thalassospira profundimaris]RCK46553.1 nitrate reductase [Thalassospira profundimaris]
MIKTFKALSALLSYPGTDLQDACEDIATVLMDERLLSPGTLAKVLPFVADIGKADIYDLQERFVALFDRSRSLSLNLFEHVHGESRDRGGAMVDLVETYRAGGFEPATTELPDHLPVLLEFLATRPLAEARATLADADHILIALRERLERRESPYACVFDALVELTQTQASTRDTAVADLLAVKEDNPDDLAALDAVWAETEVIFGPDPNAGCPQIRDMLAQMDRPTPRTAFGNQG